MDKYAVEMINITKIFNQNVVANDNITLRVKQGAIHALVGENGAGKSTLMSILFGLYEPTTGKIKINGEQVFISNPIRANELGIGMIHQHFKLVGIYRVWQNIALGSEMTLAKMFVKKNAIKSKIQAICDKYHLNVDLNAKIDDISVGMQQQVEILKILYRGANIIVFDEPTAMLSPNEITSLLTIMKQLKKDGKTIIFITHKLNEIKSVAEYATVIRLGKLVGDYKVSEITETTLATAMVGRNLVEIKNSYLPAPSCEPLLKINNLTVKKMGYNKINGLKNFNCTVHAGEIVAIAGVEGNGQRELINALSGLTKPVEGEVWFGDVQVTHLSIKDHYHQGMAYIPEDRQKYGLVLDFTVINNMVINDIDNKLFSSYGFLKKLNIQNYAQAIVNKFDIRGARGGFEISRALSGGNQQKIIVGRELSRHHQILLVMQPTRGMDIGAIEFIHEQILLARKNQAAVLLISYELDEVLALADRIIVLNQGVNSGEILGKVAKRETVGLMMTGKYKKTGVKKTMTSNTDASLVISKQNNLEKRQKKWN